MARGKARLVAGRVPENQQPANNSESEGKKRMPIHCCLIAIKGNDHVILNSSIHENECLAVMKALETSKHLPGSFDSYGVIRMRVSKAGSEDFEEIRKLFNPFKE